MMTMIETLKTKGQPRTLAMPVEVCTGYHYGEFWVRCGGMELPVKKFLACDAALGLSFESCTAIKKELQERFPERCK